jgi:hypothetical protein
VLGIGGLLTNAIACLFMVYPAFEYIARWLVTHGALPFYLLGLFAFFLAVAADKILDKRGYPR